MIVGEKVTCMTQVCISKTIRKTEQWKGWWQVRTDDFRQMKLCMASCFDLRFSIFSILCVAKVNNQKLIQKVTNIMKTKKYNCTACTNKGHEPITRNKGKTVRIRRIWRNFITFRRPRWNTAHIWMCGVSDLNAVRRAYVRRVVHLPAADDDSKG